MPWLGGARPAPILVALHNAAREAVISGHEHKIARVHLGGRIMGAKMHAENAGKAKKDIQSAALVNLKLQVEVSKLFPLQVFWGYPCDFSAF
jgi:hypothetical protein